MTYLDDLAATIREYAPTNGMPTPELDSLFRLYAVLALAKGEAVTPEDVHNAWAAWSQDTAAVHSEVRPFSELDQATQAEDRPYAEAIHSAVRALSAGKRRSPSEEPFVNEAVGQERGVEHRTAFAQHRSDAVCIAEHG